MIRPGFAEISDQPVDGSHCFPPFSFPSVPSGVRIAFCHRNTIGGWHEFAGTDLQHKFWAAEFGSE